jgi:aspartate aminotransferase
VTAPAVSAAIVDLGFPATVAQTEAARHLAGSGRRVVALASGDPDLATPAHIVEAAERALRDGETHYPPTRGTGALIEAIVAKLATENSIRVGTDQVLVTPGAKAALFSAIRSIVNPHDEVLVLDPSWVTYSPLIEIAGATPVRVQLNSDRNFRIDRELLERYAGPRTRAILLNSPCNPTGRVATDEELAAIGQFAEAHDLWIVSDEIYEHFVYDGAVHRSLAANDALAHRVLVVNGFSKAYAMTGWRLGWLVGPAPVIELASRVQAQTVTSAATFTMAAGVAALTGPQDGVMQAASTYAERRALLLGLWANSGIVECARSEGAFYLFPRIPPRLDDETVCATLLAEHGIATVPGSAFGASGAGHLRIAVTAPTDDVRVAGEAIVATFEAMQAEPH